MYESLAMYERDKKLEIKEKIVELEKGCGKLKNTVKCFSLLINNYMQKDHL